MRILVVALLVGERSTGDLAALLTRHFYYYRDAATSVASNHELLIGGLTGTLSFSEKLPGEFV